MSELELVFYRGSDARLARGLHIRRVVFIEEQAVPEDLEIDGLDPECWHVLASLDGRDLGTARVRLKEPGVAKAERVAVHADARGLGVGRAVMELLERVAMGELGATEMILGAQDTAIPFYERLGYTAYGPEFMDAGIPHRMMRRGIVRGE